jgi:hypothetical protein
MTNNSRFPNRQDRDLLDAYPSILRSIEEDRGYELCFEDSSDWSLLVDNSEIFCSGMIGEC